MEEYKKRGSDAALEAQELRKERDALKIEKNDMVIQAAKAVEEERNIRRSMATECEKLRFRVKCMEEEVVKQ